VSRAVRLPGDRDRGGSRRHLGTEGSGGFTAWQPSLLVVAGYVVSFYALSLALRTIPVGIAYAIWSGVGIVLISVIAGVAVINLFSATVRA
jgi:multidrug transporter EmrE-like cation transporter